MTSQGTPPVAAIVLAAGRGTRFEGGPKMMAVLDGEPMVRRIVECALQAGLGPVVAVTGHEAETVEACLADLDVATVRNPDYAQGLSTSLKAGFAALPAATAGAAILLGDMPAVGAGLLRQIVEAWLAAGRPPALVPAYQGRRGNPAVLSRVLAPAIAGLSGDVGAGPLLRGRADVVELAVDDAGVALDLDTAEAFARYASTTPCRIAT